jgi:tetratricopeptide (TPR) repeat protein
MNAHLIDLDRKALELRRAGRMAEAADLYTVILKERPDWEHGTACYNLAGCYEDLGELTLAEHCYHDALKYDPKNPYFLGGLAAFLYLHRDAEKAFAAYLKLLTVESENVNPKGIETALTALRGLGTTLGLSEEAFCERLGADQK